MAWHSFLVRNISRVTTSSSICGAYIWNPFLKNKFSCNVGICLIDIGLEIPWIFLEFPFSSSHVKILVVTI